MVLVETQEDPNCSNAFVSVFVLGTPKRIALVIFFGAYPVLEAFIILKITDSNWLICYSEILILLCPIIRFSFINFCATKLMIGLSLVTWKTSLYHPFFYLQWYNLFHLRMTCHWTIIMLRFYFNYHSLGTGRIITTYVCMIYW